MASKLSPAEQIVWGKPFIIPILKKVPPVDLRRFFTVCRRWRDIILLPKSHVKQLLWGTHLQLDVKIFANNKHLGENDGFETKSSRQ